MLLCKYIKLEQQKQDQSIRGSYMLNNKVVKKVLIELKFFNR